MTLNHPHSDPSELLAFAGQTFNTYADAYWHCWHVHNHPEDGYGTPDVLDLSPEDDEFEDG